MTTDLMPPSPMAPLLRPGSWHMLVALTRRDLRRRYASSRIGTLWAVLQPLGLVGIYLLVFGVVLRHGRSAGDALEFALFMLAGLLPHQATAEGLQRACSALREDKLLLEREGFPVEVIPLVRVLGAAAAEGVGLLLLVAASVASGHAAGWSLLLLPVLVLLRLLLTAGLALALSVLTVFLPDLSELLGFLLTGLLFLTPVFYTVEQMPEMLRWTLPFNPLYQLTSAYRELLFGSGLPWPALLWLCGVAALSVWGGLWLFRRSIAQARDLL